jgi:hypothetical protein
MKGLLAPFRGVLTKYLDNYLAWNGFEAENPGLNRLDLKTLLLGGNSLHVYNRAQYFGSPDLRMLSDVLKSRIDAYLAFMRSACTFVLLAKRNTELYFDIQNQRVFNEDGL